MVAPLKKTLLKYLYFVQILSSLVTIIIKRVDDLGTVSKIIKIIYFF